MRAAVAVLALIVAASAPGSALACTLMPVTDPAGLAAVAKIQEHIATKLFRTSDVIMTARVVRVDDDFPTGRTLHLRREQNLRGVGPPRIAVIQKSRPDRGDSCDSGLSPPFLVDHPATGETLLLFGRKGRSATMRLNEVVEVDTTLGAKLLAQARPPSR